MGSQRWCWTLNNFSKEDFITAQGWKEDFDLRYVIMGQEIGEGGTPHLQGYLEIKKQQRLSWVKKNLSDKAHWEPAKGTAEDNRIYCTKESGIIWEDGEPSKGQGTRTDLDEAVQMSLAEVRELMPVVYVKFNRGLKALIEDKVEAYEGPRDVVWFWGETGVGKTRTAVENGAVIVDYNNGFFDYTGSEVVLFDDFDGTIPIKVMLRLLDRYKISVNIKGSKMAWAAQKIFITCDRPPEELYAYDQKNLAQLLRRINTVLEIKAGDYEKAQAEAALEQELFCPEEASEHEGYLEETLSMEI